MSLKQLKELEATHSRRTDRPSELPLGDIFVDTEVFQWRVQRYNQLNSDAHIQTLARALRETKRALEPLLITAVGDKFFLIDGHHRLAAYRKVGWKSGVPVRYFEGKLEEARLQALAGNSRDKLPMSELEKREAAWKLVKEGTHSKSQIVAMGLVSDGTVARMRKTLKRLEEAHQDPVAYDWQSALRFGKEAVLEKPGEWIEREAQKIVDQLLTHNIGQGLAKNPDVTALALAMLSPTLPAALIREWWAADPDFKSDLTDELIREGDPYGLFGEPQEAERALEPEL